MTLQGIAALLSLAVGWQQTTRMTSGVRGDHRYETRSPVSGETRKLTDAVIERLRVAWRKPEIQTPYGPPVLVVSGTLQLLSEDGKKSDPVAWVQPITVAIARKPGDPPSMRRGFADSAFEIKNHLLNANDDFLRKDKPKPGDFNVYFSLADIHRPIENEASFAVALSLGTVAGKTAEWSSRDEVLKATVSAVSVPGQPHLSKTIQSINSCPSWHTTEFDPKIVIRTVNELHRLGRDGALKALDEYCRLGSSVERFGGSRKRNPEEIDTSDPSCLFYLVELLFGDLRDKTERQPDVELYRDIPLHREYEEFLMRSGPLWDFGEWVDRAKKSGKFRSKPLQPPNDPLEAADAYFAELVPRLKAEEPDHLRRGNSRKDRPAIQRYIRAQAIRLISSDATLKALPELDVKDAESERRWQALKKEVSKLRIRWDEELQEYRPAPKK